MEEFQIYHANGGRYVQRGVLRCVVGNIDTLMLEKGYRKFVGRLRDCCS